MKKMLLITTLAALALTGCQGEKNQRVDFHEAQGYFVRNDVAQGDKIEKITTAEKFNEYFGMAATMTTRPTEIDFSRDFVATLILDATNEQTTIRVDSLIMKGKTLNIYYTLIKGAGQDYTIRPASVLIMDKKYEADVKAISNGTEPYVLGVHNSRNSVDYAGTYKGVIPCADCSGIEMTVSIDETDNYTQRMAYLGKGPDNIFTSSGKYEWDNTGSKITLLHNNGTDLYLVGEGMLIMLDEDGDEIRGELADKYILRKEQPSDPDQR